MAAAKIAHTQCETDTAEQCWLSQPPTLWQISQSPQQSAKAQTMCDLLCGTTYGLLMSMSCMRCCNRTFQGCHDRLNQHNYACGMTRTKLQGSLRKPFRLLLQNTNPVKCMLPKLTSPLNSTTSACECVAGYNLLQSYQQPTGILPAAFTAGAPVRLSSQGDACHLHLLPFSLISE